jgi:cation transport protein ChaC
MTSNRVMRLTPELVARCFRTVEDPGPAEGVHYLSETDYRPAAARLVAENPEDHLWFLAYGSLIWKPEIETMEMRRATARGWHRAFSMKINRWRASPEQHGFMMCLDPGGLCEGAVFRLPQENCLALVEKLLHREISRPGGLAAIRWIACETEAGPLTALTFYAGPDQLDGYQPDRPPEEVAHGLARACGHLGSGADYLYNTITHLEALGIHDEYLWSLQELVAEEIKRLHGL